MSKHVMCLIVLIIASAAGAGLAQEVDPNLVAWWQFDGDASDASGNGHNGTLVGAAGFVEEGMVGGALALYNNGYVNIDGWPGILGASGVTVTAWVKTTSMGTGDTGSNSCDAIVGWGPNGAGTRFGFRINAGRLRTEHHAGNRQGDTVMADGQWHHVAVTVEANATISYPEVILYLDGRDDTRAGTDPDPYDIQVGPDVRIGSRAASNDRFFNGLIDEVRIYNRTLSAQEIQTSAMRAKAYDPVPADGAVGVTDPLLTWQPRSISLFRNVYLGTSPELGEADLVSPNLSMTLYWHPPGFEPGTTYYWRVDEIDPDGTVNTGDVWIFTYSPRQAWGPQPADGAPNIDPNVTLSWAKGLNGVSRDIYFSADEAAVAAGAEDAFKATQFDTSYVIGSLDAGTIYYWRIDEIDAAGNKTTGTVWSFTTLAEIPITDPNLIAYWKLDSGLGSTATDWSGHGHHGQFEGNPTWVPGYDGYALEFDGDNDSVIYMFDAAEEWPAFTVSLWAKAAFVSQDVWSSIYSGHTPNTAGFQIDVDGSDPGNWRVNPSGLIFGGVTTDWVHLALTATGTSAKLYYNGVWVTSGTLNDSIFNSVGISRNRNIDNRWAGIIDDVRMYGRELSFDELQLVMRINPLRAYDPQPVDNAVADLRTASPVTWTAGDNASQHDVYFGTDAAAVVEADATDTTGIYRGRQGTTSYAPSEGIEWGQQYFWRVDEVNTDGSITTGRVWAFIVADYLIIDDFESYTNESPNRVFQAWVDGLGFSPDEFFPDGDPGNGTTALVGYDIWSPESPHYNGTIMETDDVYSGRLAMPVEYNNALTPWYAEATRTWATPQNWLFNDVDTLVIHFKGAPVDFLQTGPDSLTMSAAGTDIWGTADQFRYAYKRLNGDGEIIVRVDSIVDTHASAKAGVMIRESLDPGSRHAMVVVMPRNGVAFQRRLANNDVTISTNEAGLVAPHWVKLTRTGNELTAQRSVDGVTWVDVGPDPVASTDTVVMGGAVYIGLALTSHSAGNATTAEYAAIQTSGGVSGQWQMAEIGTDHPGNSANTLYVAVEDTTGSVGIVTHPDGANAVLNGDWQQWPVDLDEFVGVNLLSVKTMSVGIGDRTNPQVDGAGQMLFDDFRITQGAPADPNVVE